MATHPHKGLLLVGHGSRHPDTRHEHNLLEAQVRAQVPLWHVHSGFIELSDPPLHDALVTLAERCTQVVVAPLLLFSGGHMQRDIPAAIAEVQRRTPQTRFVVSEPFGTRPRTVDIASTHLRDQPPSDVLLVSRGASEPVAQQGFQAVLAALSSAHPEHRFHVAYCGVQEPRVPTALHTLAVQSHQASSRPLLVLPFLLFAGRLLADIQQALADTRASHPTLQATLLPHLGPAAAPAVFEAVSDTLHGTLSKS